MTCRPSCVCEVCFAPVIRRVSALRPSYDKYIKSSAWRGRRRYTLRWARNRCQLCYSRADLEVHHRTYERLGHEHREDLIVLCAPCHARHHEALR